MLLDSEYEIPTHWKRLMNHLPGGHCDGSFLLDSLCENDASFRMKNSLKIHSEIDQCSVLLHYIQMNNHFFPC